MFRSITRTVSFSACLALFAAAGATAQPGPGYGPPAGPFYPPTYEDYAQDYAPDYLPPGYNAYPPAPEDMDGPYATEGFQQGGSFQQGGGGFRPGGQPGSFSGDSVRPLDNSGRSPFANSGGVAPTIRRTPCGFYGPGNC